MPIKPMLIKLMPIKQIPIKPMTTKLMPIKLMPIKLMPIKLMLIKPMPIKPIPIKPIPIKPMVIKLMPIKLMHTAELFLQFFHLMRHAFIDKLKSAALAVKRIDGEMVTLCRVRSSFTTQTAGKNIHIVLRWHRLLFHLAWIAMNNFHEYTPSFGVQYVYT